ncbi:MAG TPA: hypothetical protein VIJ96_01115 [Acidothermaceae bacterium]
MDAAERIAVHAGYKAEFTRHLKVAGKVFATDGWHLTNTGLIYHGPEGHWGTSSFESPPSPAGRNSVVDHFLERGPANGDA